MKKGELIEDLTGRKFGFWSVIGISATKTGRPTWLCRCVCGQEKQVFRQNLRVGKSVSCGCHGVGHLTRTFRHPRKARQHPLYSRWNAMLSRCQNPHSHAYADYGGRGIRVCGAVGSHPSEIESLLGMPENGMSLDRINNDGNYSCGSCPECKINGWPLNIRWATQAQQCRNKRESINLTIDGTTKPLKQWAEESGISYMTLYKRLKMYGWESGSGILKPSRSTK